MDKSEVKRIVEYHLPFMQWDLQVNMWKTTVEFGPCDDPTNKAHVRFDPNYGWAVITIDPESHETEEEVLRSLRHELIHIMLAPIEEYTQAVEELTHDSYSKIFQHLSTVCGEKAVLAIETMFDHGYRLPLGKRPDYAAPSANPYDEGST